MFQAIKEFFTMPYKLCMILSKLDCMSMKQNIMSDNIESVLRAQMITADGFTSISNALVKLAAEKGFILDIQQEKDKKTNEKKSKKSK